MAHALIFGPAGRATQSAALGALDIGGISSLR